MCNPVNWQRYYARHKRELSDKLKQKRQQNLDVFRARDKLRAAKYRKNNPETKKESDAKYYRANRKSALDKNKKWRKNHPEQNRLLQQVAQRNRAARKKNAQGSFDYDLWMTKVEYHGWRCFYCQCRLNENTLTIDHRKPLSKGGSNWVANLVPACRSCNVSKSAIYKGPNAVWANLTDDELRLISAYRAGLIENYRFPLP